MPRISLWNPNKANDYQMSDRVSAEIINAGGTSVIVHKYMGVSDMPDGEDPDLYIQDLLFLENRDRKYDKDLYELRGAYDIPDTDARDLQQIGFVLPSGNYMTFHENSMVDSLGRRLTSGDVIELPHLRDDLVQGIDGAINRFFVVMEGTRPAEGYDPRWWSHLWRVRLDNMRDSQEFRDILGTGEQAGDLRDLLSSYKREIAINDGIIEEAADLVPFDTPYQDNDHFYWDHEVPGKPGGGLDRQGQNGMPVNGLELLGQGASFPLNAEDGDFFLRTDFSPRRLFEKSGNRWLHIGTDYRRDWTTANHKLTGMINNADLRVDNDGQSREVRTNLSRVVKPRSTPE
jgi:hypothetical protein